MTSRSSKVLLVDPVITKAAAILLDTPGISVEVYDPKRDGRLEKAVQGYNALIVRDTKIDKYVLEAEGLEIVANVGTDATNIDLDAAMENRVVVMNSPGFEANAIAEYALGLMYSLTRSIVHGAHLSRKGKEHERYRNEGVELEGRVLGVLGLSEDGRLLAQKAKGVGMEIVVHDLYQPLSDQKRTAEEIGGRYASLDDLLRSSDVVSIHLPKGGKSKHIIGKQQLKIMKGGSYLINATCPGAVDEKVLPEALEQHVIGGVALDVREGRKKLLRDPLMGFENCIITPRLATLSKETWYNECIQTAIQVRDALTNGAYRNVVTPRY